MGFENFLDSFDLLYSLRLISSCILYECKCKWSCGPSCPVDFPSNIFIHLFMHSTCCGLFVDVLRIRCEFVIQQAVQQVHARFAPYVRCRCMQPLRFSLTMSSSPVATLYWADYVILAAFLALSIAIGVYHSLTGERQRTTDDFIMANRRLTVVPTAVSMFVSYRSAIAVLGFTAEMYMHGTQRVVWGPVGYAAACFLAERLVVPWLYPLRLVSINAVSRLKREVTKLLRKAASPPLHLSPPRRLNPFCTKPRFRRDALSPADKSAAPYSMYSAAFAAYISIPENNPHNLPFPLGHPGATENMFPVAHPSPQPKRQLDRFIRFCRVHGCVQQTDTQTDIVSVAKARIACVCGLITEITEF